MLDRSAGKIITEWISDGKDALLVTGARQIGKTYLIRECLKNSGFPYVELNFIENPELIELVCRSKGCKRIDDAVKSGDKGNTSSW